MKALVWHGKNDVRIESADGRVLASRSNARSYFGSVRRLLCWDLLDFAYFAFTLGMCFQTSDVCVTSRHIRRAVLAHALLSFLYNTIVLALAFNLVLGVFVS